MHNQSDKEKELQRFDLRAKKILKDHKKSLARPGYLYLPLYFQTPYIFYEKCLFRFLDRKSKVLEIGSGTGNFTTSILKTGTKLLATDISSNALEVLKARNEEFNNLKTEVADMELLPFKKKFDVVCSAGSLSYGNTDKVLNEIKKVLKEGGLFICVDSLNNNPIYRLNRFLAFIRGKRTRATLKQMPTILSLQKYEEVFEILELRYFGSISWLCIILSIFCKQEFLVKLSDGFDNFIRVKSSAYKFVMIAKLKST